MEFTNKTSYVQATRVWRQLYAEHSKKIRELKAQYRELQREYAKSNDAKKSTWSIYAAHRDLQNAGAEATEMIKERHASKVTAQEQYLASRK